MSTPASTRKVSDADYRRLLHFRTGLRRFLRWSEDQAGQVGLTGAQHQLLLAIKGHGDERGPTIGEVAHYLVLKPHSAVGLVDRAEDAGLVTRVHDGTDGRVSRLALTARGEELLARLSALHIEELARLAPRIQSLWADLDRSD
jgi:DNA-binding MarR family transcriptional regulator